MGPSRWRSAPWLEGDVEAPVPEAIGTEWAVTSSCAASELLLQMHTHVGAESLTSVCVCKTDTSASARSQEPRVGPHRLWSHSVELPVREAEARARLPLVFAAQAEASRPGSRTTTFTRVGRVLGSVGREPLHRGLLCPWEGGRVLTVAEKGRRAQRRVVRPRLPQPAAGPEAPLAAGPALLAERAFLNGHELPAAPGSRPDHSAISKPNKQLLD